MNCGPYAPSLPGRRLNRTGSFWQPGPPVYFDKLTATDGRCPTDFDRKTNDECAEVGAVSGRLAIIVQVIGFAAHSVGEIPGIVWSRSCIPRERSNESVFDRRNDESDTTRDGADAGIHTGWGAGRTIAAPYHFKT
jgi:hypothetical protein